MGPKRVGGRKREMTDKEKDLRKFLKLRNDIRLLEINIADHEREFDELERKRKEITKRIYEMSQDHVDQRAKVVPRPLVWQDAADMVPLFTTDMDTFALMLSRHIVLFCLREHSENVHYPYYKEFLLVRDIGKAIIIMGHKLRKVFRYYIEERYPWQRCRRENHSIFLLTYMRDLYHAFYVDHAGHIPFLILAAFAMEVIHYVMNLDTLRREFSIITVSTLASLLSSQEFESRCGLKQLMLYAISVAEGYDISHTEAEYRKLLFKHREYIPRIDEQFLTDEDEVVYPVTAQPEGDIDSAEITPTASQERLSRYVPGFSASFGSITTPATPTSKSSMCCMPLRWPCK